MSSDADSKRSSTYVSWVLGVVAAVVFYLLSPGLFGYAMLKQWIPESSAERVFTTVYAPVVYMSKKIPVVNRAYEWYFGQIEKLAK